MQGIIITLFRLFLWLEHKNTYISIICLLSFVLITGSEIWFWQTSNKSDPFEIDFLVGLLILSAFVPFSGSITGRFESLIAGLIRRGLIWYESSKEGRELRQIGLELNAKKRLKLVKMAFDGNSTNCILLQMFLSALFIGAASYAAQKVDFVGNENQNNFVLEYFGRAYAVFVMGLIAARFGKVIYCAIFALKFESMLKIKRGGIFFAKPNFDQPDGAGGFAPIGGFFVYYLRLVAIMSLYAMAWLFAKAFNSQSIPHIHINDTPGIVAVMLGVAVALVLVHILGFIAPMASLHHAMGDAKERHQEKLDSMARYIGSLRQQNWNEKYIRIFRNNQEKIETLEKFIGKSSATPLWPWSYTTRRKFTVSLIIPILTAIGAAISFALGGQ